MPDETQVLKILNEHYSICNEWLDDICDDPDCPFCSRRPQTPYEAYYLIDTKLAVQVKKALEMQELSA